MAMASNSTKKPKKGNHDPTKSWIENFKNQIGRKRFGNDGSRPDIIISRQGEGQRLGSAEEAEAGAAAPIRLPDGPGWMTKQILQIEKNQMPDLFHLFTQLNSDYFDNELKWGRYNVFAFWTKKFKEGPGHSFYLNWAGVIIDLSEPELTGKPMRDIVQTLLHEMIHAWVFFENRKSKRSWREKNEVDYDRRHGAEFMKKMNEINALSGANVGEFHVTDTAASKFVAKYTWRCNGSCRDKGPYFGWLRRRTNQAPSILDGWFEDHKKTCGGQFTLDNLPKQHENLAANFGHLDEEPGEKMAYSLSGNVVERARMPYTPYVPSHSVQQGYGYSVVNVGARKPCLPRGNDTDTNIDAFCDFGSIKSKFEQLTTRDRGPQSSTSSYSSTTTRKGYVPFGGKGHKLN